jgi:hypothetical protein
VKLSPAWHRPLNRTSGPRITINSEKHEKIYLFVISLERVFGGNP